MINQTAQFEIYDYADFFKSGKFYSTNVDWNLPEKVKKDGKTYVFLYNPGCWVEEAERARIINSHCPTLKGFDPNKRIWKIYDAIELKILIEDLAASFIKESPLFKDLPANYLYCEKNSLLQAFKLGGYPGLYHNIFVRKTPEILPDHCFSMDQLVTSSRVYPCEL